MNEDEGKKNTILCYLVECKKMKEKNTKRSWVRFPARAIKKFSG
jgi:hypothetical protein